MTLLLNAALIIIIFILIQFIGEEKQDEESLNQGTLMVELFWDDSLETDIDLWVKAPHDIPVGYSNKGGLVFNLLRDDLGEEEWKRDRDLSGRNMEIAVARSAPPGHYIVNVHLYDLDGAEFPVAFRIIVSKQRRSKDAGIKQLFSVDGEFRSVSEERTAVQFELDESGHVIPDSIHHAFTSIISPDRHNAFP